MAICLPVHQLVRTYRDTETLKTTDILQAFSEAVNDQKGELNNEDALRSFFANAMSELAKKNMNHPFLEIFHKKLNAAKADKKTITLPITKKLVEEKKITDHIFNYLPDDILKEVLSYSDTKAVMRVNRSFFINGITEGVGKECSILMYQQNRKKNEINKNVAKNAQILHAFSFPDTEVVQPLSFFNFSNIKELSTNCYPFHPFLYDAPREFWQKITKLRLCSLSKLRLCSLSSGDGNFYDECFYDEWKKTLTEVETLKLQNCNFLGTNLMEKGCFPKVTTVVIGSSTRVSSIPYASQLKRLKLEPGCIIQNKSIPMPNLEQLEIHFSDGYNQCNEIFRNSNVTRLFLRMDQLVALKLSTLDIIASHTNLSYLRLEVTQTFSWPHLCHLIWKLQSLQKYLLVEIDVPWNETGSEINDFIADSLLACRTELSRTTHTFSWFKFRIYGNWLQNASKLIVHERPGFKRFYTIDGRLSNVSQQPPMKLRKQVEWQKIDN